MVALLKALTALVREDCMMKILRWWRGVMLWLLVTLPFAAGVEGAQYPWEENDGQTVPPVAAEPAASQKTSRIQVGPFSFEPAKKMVRYHDEDIGEVSVILDDSGAVLAAIQFDTEPSDTRGTGKREAYEQLLRQSVTHQRERRIDVAGSDALLLVNSDEDGSLFHIFPYDEDSTYSLMIIYESKREQISAEVQDLLTTVKLEPHGVEH